MKVRDFFTIIFQSLFFGFGFMCMNHREMQVGFSFFILMILGAMLALHLGESKKKDLPTENNLVDQPPAA